MKKIFNRNGLIVAILCFSGSLFADVYKIDNPVGIQTDYLGAFKQQWTTTSVKGIDGEGYLHGSTVLYNNTHFPFNIATNLYIVDEDSPEKPILIHNVKKDDALDGVESLSSLTWKSNQVKHVRDPKAKKWQFWKRKKETGMKKLHWKVKISDIVSGEDEGFYIEIKNEKASDLVLAIANTYMQIGEKVAAISELMINGASINDINTSIDELVNFASGSFYVKFVTDENASVCKNILKDAAYLMLKDILPMVKDNKEEVVNFVTVAVQAVTGNIDIIKTDQAIDSLRGIVMSKANSALTKDMFTKLANILGQLNSLNVFKNSSAVDSYVVLLKKTSEGISDDKLTSQYNSVVIFDGLKLVTRIATDNSMNEISPMIEVWYNNGFKPFIESSFLSDIQVKAVDSIFKNIFTIATKENGKYFDEAVEIVNELIDIAQNKEDVGKILTFIANHKEFFVKNKTELIAVLRAAGDFVPAQKSMIETVIIVIENLQNFI
jgi:hypothetical protein